MRRSYGACSITDLVFVLPVLHLFLLHFLPSTLLSLHPSSIPLSVPPPSHPSSVPPPLPLSLPPEHLSPSESDGDMLGYDLYSSALADILSEPTMQPPICVGLYAQWGSGKSFLLKKLEGEGAIRARPVAAGGGRGLVQRWWSNGQCSQFILMTAFN